MTKNVITVEADDTMKSVGDIFSKNRIHHLPVTEDGQLIGMISKSDFLFFCKGIKNIVNDKSTEAKKLLKTKVSEVMISKLAKLKSSDRIDVALAIFRENYFHAIPIVDNCDLIGIVTTHDVITHLLKDRSAVNTYQTSQN